MTNQNPEQIARDNIDRQLIACGWIIQDIKDVNLHREIGVAVKEYLTDAGLADYVLFVSGKPCCVIEAKREEEAHKINIHEDQTERYAFATLKHLKNEPLPFVYLSTGDITRFTDFTDPKPRAREVFTFHRPEILRDWLKQYREGSRPFPTLRERLHDLPALQTQKLRECQINAIKERKPNRLKGYNYSSDNLYFVTSCVHNRVCCFGEIFPDNPASSVQRNGDIPFIGTGRDASLQRPKIKSLSELVGAYKTTVSKQIHLLERTDRSRFTDGSRPVRTFAWQRSFHEHIIRDEKSFETISDYILNNPNNWGQDNFHIL